MKIYIAKSNLYKFLFSFLLICLINLHSIKCFSDTTPYNWHEKHIVVNKNFNTVIQQIQNFENYKNILPYTNKVNVLAKNKKGSICYFEHYAFGSFFWTQIRFKIKKNNDSEFLMISEYINGNAHPYETEIHAYKINENKTEIKALMKIKFPGPSYVPDRLINYHIDEFLKTSLNNFKKQIELFGNNI